MDIEQLRDIAFKGFRVKVILAKTKDIDKWLLITAPDTKLPRTRDGKVKLLLDLEYNYIQQASEDDIRCIYSEYFD